MKVLEKCDSIGPKMNPSFDDIKPGTIFAFAGAGYRYLKCNIGAVCLDRNNLFASSNAFPVGPIPGYVEYPNARVVLE